MSDTCKPIKYMLERIKAGEPVESVIPYHVDGFSDDCIQEMRALYIKYGTPEDRRYNEMKERYINASRTNSNL